MTRFRLWISVVLIAITMPAGAAVVGGRVYIKSAVSEYDRLVIGYLGYQTKINWTQLTGETTPGSDNFSTMDKQELERYSHVMMSWPNNGACTYRCTKLKPGIYAFFAQIGNYIDWKTIFISDSNSSYAINFSINLKNCGTLKVQVPQKHAHIVHLAPAWDTDAVNWRQQDGPRITQLTVKTEIGEGCVNLPLLRNGKYLLEISRKPKGSISEQMWSGGPKRVGQWVVTVKAGKVITFKVPG